MKVPQHLIQIPRRAMRLQGVPRCGKTLGIYSLASSSLQYTEHNIMLIGFAADLDAARQHFKDCGIDDAKVYYCLASQPITHKPKDVNFVGLLVDVMEVGGSFRSWEPIHGGAQGFLDAMNVPNHYFPFIAFMVNDMP